MRRARKLMRSFASAARGVLSVIRTERNIRIHLCFLCYVLFFAWFGQVPSTQIPILFLCFGLVLAAELFNSAIERICDRVHPEFDRTIRAVKDIASGGVLVSAIMAALAGVWIFFSPAVLLPVLHKLFAQPVITLLGILSLIPAYLFCRGKKI